MGLLDNLLKIAGSKVTAAAGNQNTIGSVFDMLNSSHIGGVEGLMEKLSGSGLGKIGDSWISTGKNKSISATQLQKVLGSDVIEKLAAKLGITNKAAVSMLVQYLPLIVDKLTPDGKASSSKQISLPDILGKLLK